MKYAQVCVEIKNEAVDRFFDYSVPDEMRIASGMRVLIPFGSRSKPINGYVIEVSDETVLRADKIKPILAVLDDYPVLSDEILSLAKWMKDKYYTTLAKCLRCVLPVIKDKRGNLPAAPVGNEVRIDNKLPVLNDEQDYALKNILNSINENNSQPVLLHGVTGSGKTEVYMRAIAHVLNSGKQAIVLVPEISLTPQTVAVFKVRFGSACAVTHSRLTEKERFTEWQKARTGAVSVMIGPRSAVFAPFERLGIIIIDEEHENTYRSETAPKYDAREVAVKRGLLSNALVVLGSATPSLETYYKTTDNANDGGTKAPAIKLLKMEKRINGMFPAVNIIDMRRELVSGNTSIFGMSFQQAAAETLNAGRQIILFLNRRGHSSFVSCRRCGYVMGCDRCRVNFTYHSDEKLMCHYCGRSVAMPKICTACESPFIRYFGVGTQKVEEEAARLFPNAKALRMDMDTTRRKQGHAKILSAFAKNEAQILIGTQMIAKGLDFPNVTMVGIVAADLSLFSGDFRAAEHTFSLLTQVSGRAGRADMSGQVFIQTYNPEHYSIMLARDANYDKFYEHEIALRRAMDYPPFTHVFMILFTGADEPVVIKSLHKLNAVMKYCNKKGMFEMLGPAPAFVSKIKKQFRWKLLVKGADEDILKKFVLYCLGKLKENDKLKGIGIHLTFNPVSME